MLLHARGNKMALAAPDFHHQNMCYPHTGHRDGEVEGANCCGIHIRRASTQFVKPNSIPPPRISVRGHESMSEG